MMTSHEFLDSMKVPVLEASGKKLLKFIKADQLVTLVRLDTIHNFWGVYLFTPAKEPDYAEPVMIEERYKSYFK